jgi:poly-gamma-glutamate capsule biosynthesis protein CapA/YwtB (metallophosphatase superfamily)
MAFAMRLALAGDTMLGRKVAERLREAGPESLFAPEVVEAAGDADLVIVNLECCISVRGAPAPNRVFHFRAPPVAVEALAHLGVDCVTLANNHALDYGPAALADTLEHLRAAGISVLGAGANEDEARAPLRLEVGTERLRAVAFSDHPAEYAARPDRAGIAHVDLPRGKLPDWLVESVQPSDAEPVLVCAHWGPNMTAVPVPEVRRAAEALAEKGVALIAGHSAHVFHGVAGRVLFDLGDFVDDYRVDPRLRNDLGLLWFVDMRGNDLVGIEALPLKLDYCYTGVAQGGDREWVEARLLRACGELGTHAEKRDGRLVIEP